MAWASPGVKQAGGAWRRTRRGGGAEFPAGCNGPEACTTETVACRVWVGDAVQMERRRGLNPPRQVKGVNTRRGLERIVRKVQQTRGSR